MTAYSANLIHSRAGQVQDPIISLWTHQYELHNYYGPFFFFFIRGISCEQLGFSAEEGKQTISILTVWVVIASKQKEKLCFVINALHFTRFLLAFVINNMYTIQKDQSLIGADHY